jgi:uncharacterized protein
MTAGRVTLAILAIVLLLAALDRIRGTRRSTVARITLAAVRGYQRWISPLRPPACRFTPSCSAYAVIVLERHGALRGGWLVARRLARCGPWHPGGHDPAPPAVARQGVHGARPPQPPPPGTRPDPATSTPTGAPRC